MTAPRQSVVNTQPGIGVEGAVAGVGGARIGRFCWSAPPQDADGTNAWVSNIGGSGPVTGFIGREQQALITEYLQDAGMVIPQGFETTVYMGGDFFVVNAGTGPATPGLKAYANFADGSVTFAATGTVTAGGTSTASTIA